MSFRCSADFFEFDYPTEREPTWSHKVERWYQMDAPSYGLCELVSRDEKVRFPGLIFLASPTGCGEMDMEFVTAGATSPSKFVYTLPSIRSSALLQLLKWHGPLFCLQNGNGTIATALTEAAALAKPDECVWIIGYVRGQKHMAYRITVGLDGDFELPGEISATPFKNDSETLQWLRSQGRSA